jgi:hypothetical protein
MQGYVNLKAYSEFDARNRPSGWNAWLTLSISPAAPAAKDRGELDGSLSAVRVWPPHVDRRHSVGRDECL